VGDLAGGGFVESFGDKQLNRGVRDLASPALYQSRIFDLGGDILCPDRILHNLLCPSGGMMLCF
jgi:hypothetical protein